MSEARNEEARESTTPTRWTPDREVGGVFDARDPFERLFRLAGLVDEGRSQTGLRRVAAASPAIDVDEDDDSYEVSVELPGIQHEDVDVEIHQNTLTIRGEKRDPLQTGGGGDGKRRAGRRSRWSERSYGRFVRSFTLPRDADADRLEADFANGLLTIRIPKLETSKPRTVQVRRGSEGSSGMGSELDP